MSQDTLGIGIEAPPRNTSKVPLPESSTIRKSANGRAMLFVEGDALHQELRCNSSISQHISAHSMYHSHSLNARNKEMWRTPTDLHCWHCCHQFNGEPISAPKEYDPKEQNYVVFGCFCSFPCAKAHLLETDTFDTGLQITMLEKMARDMYGCPGGIAAAPPRLSLSMFGGPFNIDKFRRGDVKCKMQTPPFVCSYMVVEERQAAHNISAYNINATGSVRGLRRPKTATDDQYLVYPENDGTPPPYHNFIETKKGESSSSSGHVLHTPAPASDAVTKKGKSGTLAAFMKK